MASRIEITREHIASPWEALRSQASYPSDRSEIATPWETSRRKALQGLLEAEDVFAIRKGNRHQEEGK